MEAIEANMLQCFSVFENVGGRPLFPRACGECRRKKTRCNMKRPICALCERIGANCVYPTSRKTGRRPRRTLGENGTIVPLGVSNSDHVKSARISRPISNQGSEGNSAMSQEPAQQPFQRDSSGEMDTSDGSFLAAPTQGLDMLSPSMLFVDVDSFGQDPSEALFADGLIPDFSSLDDSGAWFAGDGVFTQQSPKTQSPKPGLMTSNLAFPDHWPAVDASDFSMPSATDAGTVQAESPMSLGAGITEVDEMITMFFDRVEVFVQLLHRPEFESEFLDIDTKTFRPGQPLSLEALLLLNAMFSLSARFCKSTLSALEPTERGHRFADRARHIYHKLIKANKKPSLRMLQGFILLIYHDLTLKPSFQTWLDISTGCRIAYSLSLHQIDKDSSGKDDQNPLTWAKKEERRRAWWVIYQMDNFASVIASRPFNIDATRMNVRLPVSDFDWFSYSVVPSVTMSAKGLDWQKMVDAKIRNPYAWFIVSNMLIRSAQQEFDKVDSSIQDLKILQASLHCLGYSLPSMFRDLYNGFVNSERLGDKSWIIETIILVQSAQICVTIGLERTDISFRRSNGESSEGRQSIAPEHLFDLCSEQINEHLKAVKMWTSDAITTANPLVVCALIGPAAIFAAKPPSYNDDAAVTTLRSLEWQILDLVLNSFAEYWEIGQHMHCLLQSLIASTAPADSPSKHEHPYLEGLLPSILQSA